MRFNIPNTNLRFDGLKFPGIPDGFYLVVDTREQKPLFRDQQYSPFRIRKKLDDGDYSIKGLEQLFIVERKMVGDFLSYIGRERKKTVQKMKRFREIIKSGGWVGLVIEEDEGNLFEGSIWTSAISPEMIRAALVSFEVRYGIHIYYNKEVSEIERWVLDRAIKFYKLIREV